MYGFLQVILHTYIDSLRVDDDREINHHGKSVKVCCYIFVVLFFYILVSRLAIFKIPS